MTNKIALWLWLSLALAVWLDYAFLQGASVIFLGKKLFQLTEWLAFWR